MNTINDITTIPASTEPSPGEQLYAVWKAREAEYRKLLAREPNSKRKIAMNARAGQLAECARDLLMVSMAIQKEMTNES